MGKTNKIKKNMGVQQILLHPDKETEALLQYLCQQAGKLYNCGLYFARQTFFKTGKLLTGKFDLAFESTVSKTMLAQSLPSTPMQQTLMSVAEGFKSYRELRTKYKQGELHFSFKVNADMGRLNNQKFVQMPLGKLKDRLEQLCKLYAIKFHSCEEAYTSRASYLDGDSLPKFGEKPDGWKASGNRTRRGLYRTKKGYLVNADLNGSGNILRKVSSKLGFDLSRLTRRILTTAARVKLWQGSSKNHLRRTSL